MCASSSGQFCTIDSLQINPLSAAFVFPQGSGFAAASGGHFTLDPDPDGILRRIPMLAEHGGAYYEPLSLAIVRMLLGGAPLVPGYPSEKIWSKNYSGLEWIEVGPVKIPVDELVTALIPYRGKGGREGKSFKYVSAVDVINERAELDELKGKIVLVGTTAPGLLDLRATPVEGQRGLVAPPRRCLTPLPRRRASRGWP